MVELGLWSSPALRLGLMALALLVLKSWDLDHNLYNQLFGFQYFGLGLECIPSVFLLLNPSDLESNYTTSFSGFTAYRMAYHETSQPPKSCDHIYNISTHNYYIVIITCNCIIYNNNVYIKGHLIFIMGTNYIKYRIKMTTIT